MLIKSFLMIMLLVSSSCGGFHLFESGAQSRSRKIASIASEHLIYEENKVFQDEIEERLQSLHIYYVIAQKNLHLFDESITKYNLDKLYQSQPYLNLTAIKSQVEGIESDLVSIYELTQSDPEKRSILFQSIKDYSKRSTASLLSFENLNEKLNVEIERPQDLTFKEIEEEYKRIEALKEFQIYEKNIEHISHLMDVKIRSQARKIKPSASESGTISGEEFPAKVWALTFDNGPSRHVTSKILRSLREKEIKATFFLLSDKTKDNISLAKEIQSAGMEVGSHSKSNKNLSQVGHLTLQKEITESTKEIEKNLKTDITLFRLPFGAGASVPDVRETIAENDLIHVFWNVDSIDWMAQTPKRIAERTKKLMKKTARDAGIILFHDINQRSAESAQEVMEELSKNARRSCILSKIIDDMNKSEKGVCQNT